MKAKDLNKDEVWGPVSNVYDDKVEDSFKTELDIHLQIANILGRYNYEMYADYKNGVASIELRPLY